MFLDFVDVNYDTNVSQQILIGAESYSSILKSAFSPWPLPQGSRKTCGVESSGPMGTMRRQ